MRVTVSRMLGIGIMILALAGCAGPREEVIVETGYRGRARLNPFLAGWRLLEHRQWIVEERHGLTVFPADDTVLVLPAESDRGGVIAERLVEWIEAGGHLVYLLTGGDRYLDDWRPEPEAVEPPAGEDVEPAEPADAMEEPEHPLLDFLGLRVRARPESTQQCELGGRVLQVDMPAGFGIRIPRTLRQNPAVIRSAGPGPAGLASFPFGEGRLTVLGDAHPWRSRFIGEEDHARFFWEVMKLHGEPRAAWFLSDTAISFFALLWRHGWMPCIGLGLFVIFWLWRSIPRFGPLAPDAAPASRDFSGHLAQAGAFLWGRAGASSLVAPIRRTLLTRLSRHSGPPEPGTTLSAGQLEELARVTGLDPKRIQEALSGDVPRHPSRFIELLSTLQTIESHCP